MVAQTKISTLEYQTDQGPLLRTSNVFPHDPSVR